jgi:hypothetical protein
MKTLNLTDDERYLISIFRGASPELKETLSRAFDALKKQNIQQENFPPFSLIQGGKS